MKINLSWFKEVIKFKISKKLLIKQLIMLGIEVEKISPLFISYPKNKTFILGKILDYKLSSEHNYVYYIYFGGLIKGKIISNQKVLNFKKKKIIVILKNKFLNLSKDRSSLISLNKYNTQNIYCNFLVFNYLGLTEAKHHLSTLVETLDNIPLGKVLNKQLHLNDIIIKLNTPLNRIDLKNLIGICREIYAFNRKDFNICTLKNFTLEQKKDLKKKIKTPINVSITIKNDPKYFFYLGRVIQDIDYNLKEIPFCMYHRLLISDRFYNNNLLNIINYVFLETGIIINIYDVEIIGKELIINSPKSLLSYNLKRSNILTQELFTTNSKNQVLSISGSREFNTNFISKVSKNLYIESISLTNEFILDYESSYFYKFQNNFLKINNRYKQLIYDSNLQFYAMNRVTILIHKLFGGYIGPMHILGKKNIDNFVPYKIYLPIKKIKNIVGQTINFNKVKNILKYLNFKYKILNKFFWLITPPVWRIDIHVFQDLIEDILKYYGYNKIKLKKFFFTNVKKKENHSNIYIDNIKSLLVHKGYQEIISYSFVDIKKQELLFSKAHNAIQIINPISNELSCIRSSLINGLLTNIIYNQNYQVNRLKLFEIGLCYEKHINSQNNNKKHTFLKQNLFFKEKFMLSGAIFGKQYERKWCFPFKLPDLYDIKGDIENIFEVLLINPDLVNFSITYTEDNIFLNKKCANIYFKNNLIGKFGLIDENILKILKIKDQVIYFELYLEEILLINCKDIQNSSLSFSNLPIYSRDLSFVVDNNLPIINIIKECRDILKKYLLHINVFDIYADTNMKKNNKISFGINLILQDIKETLNNKEINNILNTCINSLIKKFNVRLRE